MKHPQQLHRLFVHRFFGLEKARQTQHTGQGVVFCLIMQANFYIVQHTHVLEQTNVLKGAGNTAFVDLDRGFAGKIFTIQRKGAGRRFVHTGQQVKNGGFSGAVRPNQPIKLTFINGQIHIIHRAQATKRNAQSFYF